MADVDEDKQWDRRAGEPARSHAAFRVFRDLSPGNRRLETVAKTAGVTDRAVRLWAKEWEWWDRAEAWDRECYRLEDAERLDAIRTMHSLHRRAGRNVVLKAMASLNGIEPSSIPLTVATKLLELGARLERSTLVVSVHDLQGIDDPDEEDPWERLARELTVPS